MRVVSFFLLFLLFVPVVASAQGEIGRILRGSGIKPLEDIGREADRFSRDAQQGVRRMFKETQVETVGPALATAIRASRNDARRAGTNQIPSRMYRLLRHCFSSRFLNNVEYRVGQGHELSLQANSFRFGGASAIALDDTVIFRRSRDAQDNLWLWAHELQHIDQYDRWGVLKFAKRYVRDHRAVEDEADRVADRCVDNVRYARDRTSTRRLRDRRPPRSSRYAEGASICVTRNFRCRLSRPAPARAPCSCFTRNGRFHGWTR